MNALDVLQCPEWTAIYRSKKHRSRQVVLNSVERPALLRDFNVPGKGTAQFTAVSITKLVEPKEGFKMATKKKSRKGAKKKKKEEEVEELEGLDDLDDEDDEEPEDEDEDVEEDDEDEDEDDDDEEDEDEEEDEPPKKRKKSKKSKTSKSKKKKGTRGPTGPREMPKGKLSAQDVAEQADTDARAVRLFLRKKANKKKFPKDKELGRYAFTKTQAKEIVRAMKSSAKEDDDEDEDDE